MRGNYLNKMLGLVLALYLVKAVESACPCLTSDSGALDEYRNSDNTLSYRGFSYPSDYGFGSCKQWDIDPVPLPPFCGDSQNNAALPDAPEFCRDSWCYIDPDNCDSELQYVSGVFPDSGLTFSSEACGNAGTYSDFFTTGSGHSLTELADIVEDYVAALARDLEYSILENDFSSVCPYTDSCPCDTCVAATGWGMDVDFSKTLLKPFQDDADSVTTLSSCLSRDVDMFFSRVAGREYQDATEFATLYLGFQEDGAFMQWPAIDLCSITYDPRFRPWYAAAATNPKIVVMVIDVSGSMSGDRIVLARQAALAVLDTLTAVDQVGMVLFNHAVVDELDPLHVSDGNRTVVENFIQDSMDATGGTAFMSPLRKGLDMLENSRHCDALLLFMTDGEPNPGFEMSDADFDEVRGRAEALNAPIFTYALGSGADTEAGKKLACENQGISYAVDDTGDLAGVMSGYYEYFAAAVDNAGARWVNYNDFASGTELLSACSPFYDKRDPDALTTTLAGVVCMDINVMKSVTDLRLNSEWSQLANRVRQPSLVCLERWDGMEFEDVPVAIESIRERNIPSGAVTCSSDSKSAGLDAGTLAGIIVGVLAFLFVLWLGSMFGSKGGDKGASVAPAPSTPPALKVEHAPPPYQSAAVQQQPQVVVQVAQSQPQMQPQMTQPQMMQPQPQMQPQMGYTQQPQMMQPQMGYAQQPQMMQPQMGYAQQPQMMQPQVGYAQQPQQGFVQYG